MELINPIRCPIELRGEPFSGPAPPIAAQLFIDCHVFISTTRRVSLLFSLLLLLPFLFEGTLRDLKGEQLYLGATLEERHLGGRKIDTVRSEAAVEPHERWAAGWESGAPDEILIRRRRQKGAEPPPWRRRPLNTKT